MPRAWDVCLGRRHHAAPAQEQPETGKSIQGQHFPNPLGCIAHHVPQVLCMELDGLLFVLLGSSPDFYASASLLGQEYLLCVFYILGACNFFNFVRVHNKDLP